MGQILSGEFMVFVRLQKPFFHPVYYSCTIFANIRKDLVQFPAGGQALINNLLVSNQL